MTNISSTCYYLNLICQQHNVHQYKLRNQVFVWSFSKRKKFQRNVWRLRYNGQLSIIAAPSRRNRYTWMFRLMLNFMLLFFAGIKSKSRESLIRFDPRLRFSEYLHRCVDRNFYHLRIYVLQILLNNVIINFVSRKSLKYGVGGIVYQLWYSIYLLFV